MKLRKRSDGYWTTQVRIEPGRYKSVYARTKKECAAKAERLLVKVSNGDYEEPDPTTLEEWYDRWIESYTGDLKESSRRKYSRNWTLYIKDQLGAKRIQEITHDDIQRWVGSLSSKMGLAPGTVANAWASLSRLFKDALKAGFVKVNPCLGVSLPKKTRKEMNVIESESIPRFIEAADQTTCPDLFKFLLLTGIRVGEARGLTIGQYNPATGSVTIDRQMSESRNEFSTPKSNKPRVIVLCGKARGIVESRISEIMDHRKDDPGFDPLDIVFFGKAGTPLPYSRVFRQFKKAAKLFGRPDLRLHDLRHTFATVSLEAGVDVKTLQETLGHSSAAMTLDRYSHSTDGMKRKAASVLDSVFGK